MPTATVLSNTKSRVSAFSFEGADVRVLNRSDEPWWVLADVCKVLEISNAPKAATRLDDDEKSTITISDSGNLNAERTIINESGLYSLILTSRKPAAKRFKKWVASPLKERLCSLADSSIGDFKSSGIRTRISGSPRAMKPPFETSSAIFARYGYYSTWCNDSKLSS